jgi:sugar lactone lactonase YvrE
MNAISKTPRILASRLALGESVRWRDGRVWVADWGKQELLTIQGRGPRVELMAPSMPFCIDWLPDGRLLLVSGGERQVLRRERDGSLVTHAELGGLSGFAWNEIAVDGRGNAYVNCIGFDFPGGDFAPGIVALVTPDGTAREVADGLAFPNGMAVTPDGSTLIVAESHGHQLTAFTIAADGSLRNRRSWAALGEGAAPDGICLDAEGAVWYADVPNRACVRVREGGEAIDRVQLDRGGFSCALGGEDGRTLFIAAADWAAMGSGEASGQVLAVEVAVPGAAFR